MPPAGRRVYLQHDWRRGPGIDVVRQQAHQQLGARRQGAAGGGARGEAKGDRCGVCRRHLREEEGNTCSQLHGLCRGCWC